MVNMDGAEPGCRTEATIRRGNCPLCVKVPRERRVFGSTKVRVTNAIRSVVRRTSMMISYAPKAVKPRGLRVCGGTNIGTVCRNKRSRSLANLSFGTVSGCSSSCNTSCAEIMSYGAAKLAHALSAVSPVTSVGGIETMVMEEKSSPSRIGGNPVGTVMPGPPGMPSRRNPSMGAIVGNVSMAAVTLLMPAALVRRRGVVMRVGGRIRARRVIRTLRGHSEMLIISTRRNLNSATRLVRCTGRLKEGEGSLCRVPI